MAMKGELPVDWEIGYVSRLLFQVCLAKKTIDPPVRNK
jgi:hypothetical protein